MPNKIPPPPLYCISLSYRPLKHNKHSSMPSNRRVLPRSTPWPLKRLSSRLLWPPEGRRGRPRHRQTSRLRRERRRGGMRWRISRSNERECRLGFRLSLPPDRACWWTRADPQSFVELRLGTGSFGRVHLVRSKHNGRFYAIKVLNKEKVVRMKQVEHTNSEREMLVRVRHPFLVNLWGTFHDVNNLYMVMDFVAGGELFSLLRKSQVNRGQGKRANRRHYPRADSSSGHLSLPRRTAFPQLGR